MRNNHLRNQCLLATKRSPWRPDLLRLLAALGGGNCPPLATVTAMRGDPLRCETNARQNCPR
eukprot:11155930-Lingulodinium_polyedra.AAC.1